MVLASNKFILSETEGMCRTHSQDNDESCLIIFRKIEKLILRNYSLENLNHCDHHKMNKNLKLVWGQRSSQGIQRG